jgi:hypothetical protein
MEYRTVQAWINNLSGHPASIFHLYYYRKKDAIFCSGPPGN